MKTFITAAALALGLAAPALAQDTKPAPTPSIAPSVKPADAPKTTPVTAKQAAQQTYSKVGNKTSSGKDAKAGNKTASGQDAKKADPKIAAPLTTPAGATKGASVKRTPRRRPRNPPTPRSNKSGSRPPRAPVSEERPRRSPAAGALSHVRIGQHLRRPAHLTIAAAHALWWSHRLIAWRPAPRIADDGCPHLQAGPDGHAVGPRPHQGMGARVRAREPARDRPADGLDQLARHEREMQLAFDTKEEAIAYAERNGIAYRVIEPQPRTIRAQVLRRQLQFGRMGRWTH